MRRSIPDRGERNAGIKSNEPSFMLNRESKQVYIGQLPRPSMKDGSRSEEHTSELQSPDHLVCRLLLEKKKTPMQPVQAHAASPSRTLRAPCLQHRGSHGISLFLSIFFF